MAGEAPIACPVRARPSTSRRLHFDLDPLDQRRCRAAPDPRAAEPQVCSCVAVDGRMRVGKRLALAGGPEAGSRSREQPMLSALAVQFEF